MTHKHAATKRLKEAHNHAAAHGGTCLTAYSDSIRPLFRPESGRHSVLKAAGIPVNPASC